VRLVIAAVGKLKAGPIKALYDDYAGRLPWPVTLKEIANRTDRTAAERMRREGRSLLAAVPDDAALVALDGHGRALASEAFAERLRAFRDGGAATLAFAIGGADGLDEAVRRRASVVLAFGPQTWPHLLVRVMLAEQLYRAATLLAGHPYHRGPPHVRR
jgi:23S rRNA (pseudouridine1915-N3)-methyltransferase